MTPHLLELGFHATIFTTQHKYREEIADEWMVELVGKDFEKIEIRSLPQFWTRKIGIGDLGLRWIPFLFPKLLMTVLKQKPDFILYPVPPWYLLVIAPVIKFFTGVKYGIDFIDPWVEGGKLPTNASTKRKISQFIAKSLEGWVCKHASIIYSVSEGINKSLIERHPKLQNKPFFAISYGIEQNDYLNPVNHIRNSNDPIQLRYIGAISDDSFTVAETLICALKTASEKNNIKVAFIGTSYAGKGMAVGHLTSFIKKYHAENIISEDPNRVSYKKAIELTYLSDIMMVFGGMQPYYAASKLMGLIASKKPFIAFLHRDSFPCLFLEQLNYPYLVKYSQAENDLPQIHVNELTSILFEILHNFSTFEGVKIKDEILMKKYTAKGMTLQFIEPINNILG